jgi:hypothetical protein
MMKLTLLEFTLAFTNLRISVNDLKAPFGFREKKEK